MVVQDTWLETKRSLRTLKERNKDLLHMRITTKEKILGTSDVGGGNTLEIKDALFVEGWKHNLLSISQLCDKGLKVIFESDYCTIHQKDSKEVALKGMRHNNIYFLILHHLVI